MGNGNSITKVMDFRYKSIKCKETVALNIEIV